ncbi:MAG TPA: aminopeptidase, partial [Firmicutes bacterium]|nr:aminopeptidase [Bacillota bacterium]
MNFDLSYFYALVKDILTTPSPSGYTKAVVEKIQDYAMNLGLETEKSTKGNLIITFPGTDTSKTLGLSAHVDTLGLMVRSINSDGTLRVTSIGGNQFMTLLGEYCLVHTRQNKQYTGTVLSTAPASHVYEECSKTG